MPYTAAFIKEVFRISTTAPFANFHETTTNVEFHGYWIPKGTVVIGNLYGANHDEKTWGDPENFRPERFLVKNGKSVPPAPLSSSVGLRACPGQSYARNSFFLYLVTIVQNFTISFDHAVNPVQCDAQIAVDSLVSVFRFSRAYTYKMSKRE